MKRLQYILGIFLICGVSHAGVISHTDYTAGNVITAAGQNSNENTIVNEINGNLDSANIENGGIVADDLASDAVTTIKILDSNVTYSKLESAVKSTFTYIQTFGTYRAPNLSFINVTTIDVENNTGTENQTCVEFPDERRCVTENTAATSVNRRAVITETCSLSGTKNSGMTPGEAEAVNTWYAVYAVKATDVSTDFVLCITTNTPRQATYSALNTRFNTNGWKYLGLIRNGDSAAATGDIVSFRQVGNFTVFNNATSGANYFNYNGLLWADTAGATSLTLSGASGTGDTQVPFNIPITCYIGGANAGSGATSVTDDAASTNYGTLGGAIKTTISVCNGNNGYIITNGSSVAMNIYLTSFYDGALGPGFNPQL